ncbi:MAG: transcription elongation factor GreB [Candidatus Accumulibacter sp.]|jgi:transcription elongation factor GreB|nr:transcription elongation factor GreB [Accumulibacter sp.]
MNKAFTRENDGEDEEEDAGPLLRLPPGTRNYITPGGYARMRDELDFLLKTERPRIVDTVQWAASNGDRSENGDYLYGKKRLREIDRRIRFLTKRMDAAEVVDPAVRRENLDRVFFGATVTVGIESGETHIYRIVGVDETDAAKKRISWISPLARALIKACEGDTVRFLSPSGWREIDVLRVEYLPVDP